MKNKKIVIGISIILLLIILAAGCIDSVPAKEEFNERFTITYKEDIDNIAKKSNLSLNPSTPEHIKKQILYHGVSAGFISLD